MIIGMPAIGFNPHFYSVAVVGSGGFQSVTPGTATIICPTTVLGDILVAWTWVGNGSGSTPGASSPTGFTQIVTLPEGGAFRRYTLSAKRALGTEGGSSFSAAAGASFSQIGLVHLRLSNPPSAVTIGAGQGSGPTDGNPAAIQVAAASPNRACLVVAGYLSGGAIDPRTFTPAKDGEQTPSGGTGSYIAWKLFPFLSQAVDIDIDDEGVANTVAGGRIDLVL